MGDFRGMAREEGTRFSSEVVTEVWGEHRFVSKSGCDGAKSDMVEGLQGCRRLLHSWFCEQGLSEDRATHAIQLCKGKFLEEQPRPTAWNRRGSFGVSERRRYLWYRHAARLLGWCERKQFPPLVTDILRSHVYRSIGEGDEESCLCPREVSGFPMPVTLFQPGSRESGREPATEHSDRDPVDMDLDGADGFLGHPKQRSTRETEAGALFTIHES
ncbi:hypothetical protein M758_UG193600 [Ceratodon purpureus]|nr:hypothetical protein M758_UG193600 [Ceratodon purpureus]